MLVDLSKCANKSLAYRSPNVQTMEILLPHKRASKWKLQNNEKQDLCLMQAILFAHFGCKAGLLLTL